MGLPSRAVEDAIWAMGAEEIASRANHGPFLINPSASRSSRSPPLGSSPFPFSAGAAVTSSVPSEGFDAQSDELEVVKRRPSSPYDHRSRTQSESVGGSSGTVLPQPQGDAVGERYSEGSAEQEFEAGAGANPERDKGRGGWMDEVAGKTSPSVPRTSARLGISEA